MQLSASAYVNGGEMQLSAKDVNGGEMQLSAKDVNGGEMQLSAKGSRMQLCARSENTIG